MTRDSRTVLLDVGGTFIKCEDGRQVPIRSAGSREEISGALRAAVGPVGDLAALGVAIPGPFDYRNGVFLMKHKFAAVYGCGFRELAGIPDGFPAVFLHDVNAVLEGAVAGMGLEGENCALVTLGTGLGFSVAMKGKVLCNEQGSPARGLWNKPWEGGILEDRISARGISGAYAKLSGESGLSAFEISQRARSGDAAALQTYEETGALLGSMLKAEVKELGLGTILMGGQISKSLDLMEGRIREALPGVRILPAPAGAVFDGLRAAVSRP